jgi:hypothetical protein
MRVTESRPLCGAKGLGGGHGRGGFQLRNGYNLFLVSYHAPFRITISNVKMLDLDPFGRRPLGSFEPI